jgi:branched-chain amino acid transport system substrate-binding protein
MGYGRSAAVDGLSVSRGLFNPPVTTYQMQDVSHSQVAIKDVGDKSGGLDKLKGKTIVLPVSRFAPYGKEPIPLPRRKKPS